MIADLSGEGLLFNSAGSLDANILSLAMQLTKEFQKDKELPVLHDVNSELNSGSIGLEWANQEITFFPSKTVGGGNAITALLAGSLPQADMLEVTFNANRVELEEQFKASVLVSVLVTPLDFSSVSAALDSESEATSLTQ